MKRRQSILAGRRNYLCGCAVAALALVVAGCSRRRPPPPQPAVRSTVPVAAGVTYRFFPSGDSLCPRAPVYVIDVDLRSPHVRLAIAAENAEPHKGAIYADAHIVPDWCGRRKALAGVNGGFFGQTDGTRKEIVGLLAIDGRIHSSGNLYRSPRSPDRRFVRSVLALNGNGEPHIGWMTGRRGGPALLGNHDRPLNPAASTPFKAVSAVACGPRLVQEGAIRISDADEKLGSPPAVPRTFVAFDRTANRPSHFVLCVTPAMTYADAAAFLQAYFHETHGTSCQEAMCLDGGSSSQMAYRGNAGIVPAFAMPVTVPTAVLVMER